MKGPLRRISFRRRPADPSPQEAQPTAVAPPQAPAATLPAGLAPDDVAPSRASFRDRGRLRRRLRYLRRVRELGFRDLGGLVFDLHRFRRRNDELVLGKLAALDAVDRELRAIERALDERRDIIELREPGVAACPRCGALHGSDARFCPQCGTQLSGPLALGWSVSGPAAPDAPTVAHGAPAGAGAPVPGVPPAVAPIAEAAGAETAATTVAAAPGEQPAPAAPPVPEPGAQPSPPEPGAEQPAAAATEPAAEGPAPEPDATHNGVHTAADATPPNGVHAAPPAAEDEPQVADAHQATANGEERGASAAEAEQPAADGEQPVDQPTVAMSPLDGDAGAPAPTSEALTSGDPLAGPDRPAP
jgi:ribosomal protein L40E